MKQTRPSECKNLKKLAIMILQEKDGDSTTTTIDYVGDETLKKEYDKDVAMGLLNRIIES